MAGKIIKASTGLHLGLDAKAYEDGKPHPHPQVEDVVNTVGFSLVQELIQYLKGPDGEEAMEYILERQGRVLSTFASSNEAREATRAAAQEATVGTYDALQRKWLELWQGIPPFVAILVAAYFFLLSLGFLLTCWRFVLHGLH